MGTLASVIVLLQLLTLGWYGCAYYLSSHDNVLTWRNEFQKLTKIWRKYIDSALTKYIQHSSENIVGFNKMLLRYLHIKLLEATNCRNQIESQLEFYNHKVRCVCGALGEGPIELKLVFRSLLTVGLNKTQPIGQECVQIEYTTYNNVDVLLHQAFKKTPKVIFLVFPPEKLLGTFSIYHVDENFDYFWQVDK